MVLAVVPAWAERLPVRTWTMAEGLPNEGIASIDQDSRGFLWIGTEEGLSRFDGESFVTFGAAEGLPATTVTGVIETAEGHYWIAGDTGLIRFDPEAARQPFTLIDFPAGHDRRLRGIRKARDGGLWLASWGGLLRLRPGGGARAVEPIDLAMPDPGRPDSQVNDIHEEADGTLWIATRFHGLIRLPPGGRPAQALPMLNIRAIAADDRGDLWIGSSSSLIHARPDPAGSGAGARVIHSYTRQDGLSGTNVYAIIVMRDGRIAVATERGVSILAPGGDAPRAVTVWAAEQGLESDFPCSTLTEDRDGNLWVGSSRAGLARISPDGFTLWRVADGLASALPQALVVDSGGRLVALAVAGKTLTLQPFDGQTFARLPAPQLGERMLEFWGWSQIFTQSLDGGWWLATGRGVLRLPAMPVEGLARAAPVRAYTVEDGVPYDNIFRIYEDSRGDLWISAYNLARWERATGRIGQVAGATTGMIVASFAEDASGQIWMGGYHGGLFRRRGDGIDRWFQGEGVPPGGIYALHCDARGGIWIGSTDGGAGWIDDTSAATPTIRRLTMADGLSSNLVQAITEDHFGRIYFGTGRGVDRYDPETGKIRRFTSADGLGSGAVTLARRDGGGDLWFATPRGLSRLTPKADVPSPPPEILLTEVRVGGEPIPMSRTGATRLEGLDLPPDRRHIEIVFASVFQRAGERPRYQYRIEPGDGAWSAPSPERTVNFAHLAPGRYRFQVRAVDASGQTSLSPASVAFLIPMPFYLQGWFLALGASLIAGAMYTIHRQRVARLLAIERVRTRIATDLHDDIGSSLTQIAIQSEVLQRRMSGAEPADRERLDRIAAVSSEMVDSMSDIVWAIHPGRDRLRDLVGRMRRFARDTLDAKGIALEFPDPEQGLETALEAGLRRDLYLIFKESLTNAARHSGCRTVRVDLKAGEGRVVMQVRDDGAGFDTGRTVEPLTARGGHGLAGLRRRASAMGADLVVESEAGGGTTVRLSVPIDGAALRRGRAPENPA